MGNNINRLVTMLLTIHFLSTAPVFAAQFTLPTKKSEPAEPSKKERFIHWVQNRHSPEHLGDEDPDLPSFIKFKPLMIPLPWGYQVPKMLVVRDEHLDMRSLTPQVLENLAPSDLKILLEYLATVPVEIKWSNQKGQTRSGKKLKQRVKNTKHWEESNAAAALALTMGIQYQLDIFTTMISLAPEAILPEFRGHVPGLLNPRLTAQIIGNMLGQLTQGNSGRLARIISHLTERGLGYWVGKDITKLNPYLAEMLSATTQILEAGKPHNKEAVLGLLLGSVLAGTMNHVEAIKRTDEKRIWIVGVVSNLVWAATSFVACVPVAAPIAAATAGGISIGAVLSSTIYTVLDFPRDFSPSVKEIEGNLEIAALESTLQQDVDVQINMLMMLTWMRAAIHVNGLYD